MTGKTNNDKAQNRNRLQRYENLRQQLDIEFSSFSTHYQEISDYVLTRRARFTVTDNNRGDKRNQNIIDPTATFASRTMSAGLMAGLTSPARPWFALGVEQALQTSSQSKLWLDQVTRIIREAFLRSNLYKVLPVAYKDVGNFATGCILMEEDFNESFRFKVFPVGSYRISTDDTGRVRVFAREFRMTVRQLVNKFGMPEEGTEQEIDWSNISMEVKNLWEKNERERWIDIYHIIEPNPEYDPRKSHSRYKKFSSVYYELGQSGNSTGSSFTTSITKEDKILRSKGYDYFPVLAPRWEVADADIYGTDCPGMTSLAQVKQLQHGEIKGLKAIDKMIDPPMKGPSDLRKANPSIVPGDITYTDSPEGFTPIHEVRFDLNALEAKQAQVRQQISRSYFEDLFLMIANSDRRQITAEEIIERREEKLLALGPVIEQLNDDLLDPLIENAYLILDKQGFIPEPPEGVANNPIKIEYVSIMHQAQKSSGLAALERTTRFVGELANFDPSVVKKLKLDKIVDEHAEITGMPARLLNDDEEYNGILDAEAQAQQQAMQAEQAAAQVQSAKTLSETDPEGGALGEMLKAAEAGAIE